MDRLGLLLLENPALALFLLHPVLANQLCLISISIEPQSAFLFFDVAKSAEAKREEGLSLCSQAHGTA